jgi:hypothetical protein
VRRHRAAQDASAADGRRAKPPDVQERRRGCSEMPAFRQFGRDPQGRASDESTESGCLRRRTRELLVRVASS